MKISQSTLKVVVASALAPAVVVAGYLLVQTIRARSVPARLVVDAVSVSPADARDRLRGFDTRVIVKVHAEGRMAAPRNYAYAGSSCKMTDAHVVYTQGGKEQAVVWPKGSSGVAPGFNSGGPGDSFFWVSLALGRVPPQYGHLTLRAALEADYTYNVEDYTYNVEDYTYNVEQGGRAWFATFLATKPKPFSLVVR